MSFSKSLFGSNEWDSVEQDVTNLIKREVGEEKFVSFTSLCNKYNIFNQLPDISAKFRNDSPERPLELRLTWIVGFFTNVGNELGGQSIQQDRPELARDAIEFLNIALILNPRWWPARFDLSHCYMIVGQIEEAQKEAKQTKLYMKKDLTAEELDSQVKILNWLKEIAAGRMPY